MNKSALVAAAAIVAGLFEAGASAATLLGASVSEVYNYPALGTPYPLTTYAPQSFLVGAGQESAVSVEGVTTINVDFSDLALDLAFDTILADPTWGSSPFNGLVFTSSAFSNITGFAIAASSNFAGFDASRVSIVGNELRLDWNGLGYNSDTVLGLDFTSSAVPELATWMMMILGFGAVGGVMRFRPRQATRSSFT